MKILLALATIGALFVLILVKSYQPTVTEFYSLNDGNQNDRVITIEISQAWLDSIQTKYNWQDFNEYDNRMWEYMYKLFDENVKESGLTDEDELWLKLNRNQKIFWAFLAFNGDTDNGGVAQFFENRPKFRYVVLETWQELGLKNLASDYKEILNLHEKGKVNLNSTLDFENNYYNEEFKKKLYMVVSDHIESNLADFALLEK